MLKRKIRARELVMYIRAGMSDADLMEKYKLSAKGLQSAYQQLLKANALTERELQGRSPGFEDTVTVEDTRRLNRTKVRTLLPIYETRDFLLKGRVRDINEKGVGIQGIQAIQGELKEFVIASDEFVEVDPFVFEAECRWVKKEDNEEIFSGFEITKISDASLQELRRLIQLLLSFQPGASAMPSASADRDNHRAGR